MTDAKSPNRGFHPILEKEHPYIFVDGCMQIWRDADFANAHRHGVTAVAVTAWEPNYELDQALEGIMYWHLIARKFPNIIVATSVQDIRRAKRENKAALILASQGGDFIGTKLHRVEAFYRLGLRMLILAYTTSNALCDGGLERTNGGLTRLGEAVVKECNRLGIVLDCAHVGGRASLEIIEQSTEPIVFSHANARAVVENVRNIDDEQILACTKRGGVIGIVNWGPLLFKKGATARPTIDDFLEQADYIAQLTGSTENIGIGSDFSFGSYPLHKGDVWGGGVNLGDISGEYDKIVPPNPHSWTRFADGFSNYTEVVDFIDRLKQRGYKEQDVRGILGENFLRVYEKVWK